jgi:hypothetical protein
MIAQPVPVILLHDLICLSAVNLYEVRAFICYDTVLTSRWICFTRLSENLFVVTYVIWVMKFTKTSLGIHLYVVQSATHLNVNKHIYIYSLSGIFILSTAVFPPCRPVCCGFGIWRYREVYCLYNNAISL